MRKNISKNTFLVFLFTVALLQLFSASVVRSQSDEIINFQGKIVNQVDGTNLVAGTPSCVVAGASNDTCDFRVRIYTAPVGGTLLWSEVHANVEIGDYNGVFNLEVNSVCSSWGISGCSASGVDWGDGSSKYLQIEFDTDGNGDFVGPEVFDRDLLTSAAYSQFSQNSNTLDGIDSTGFVQTQPSAAQSLTGTTSLIWLNESGASTPNLLQLQVGGLDYITFDNNGGAVFNEAGNPNGDFRVEGDTYANLFSIDASANEISIGTGGTPGNGLLQVIDTNNWTNIYSVNSGTGYAFIGESNSAPGAIAMYLDGYDSALNAVAELNGIDSAANYTQAGAQTTVSGINVSALNNGAGNITNLYGVRSIIGDGGAAGVVTNSYAFYADTPTINSGTDNYAFYIEDQTSGATNDYGVYIAGADTLALWVDNDRARFDGGIQLGADSNDLISQTSSGAGATLDLYYGNDLLCDVSEVNCGWAPLTASSLFTDGGATTYLTATADDFAIGGTTLTSPFSIDVSNNIVRIGDGVNDALDPTLVFYSSDGASSSAITVIDGGGFNFDSNNDGTDDVVINSLGYLAIGTTNAVSPFTLDIASNPLTGNANASYWNVSYDPTGGSGTDSFNVRELIAVVNAGDGTNQSRFRGDRVTLTNNSAGVISGLYGQSNTLTNNGFVSGIYQNYNYTTNNSTVGSAYSGHFTINNTGTITTDQFTIQTRVDNNGTTNELGSIRGLTFNYGTATSVKGTYFDSRNESTGNISGDYYGQYLKDSNIGSITGNYYGIFHSSSNATSVTADYIGFYNYAEGGVLAGGTVGGVTKAIENNLGNISGTGAISLIENNLFDGVETNGLNDIYGIRNNINGNLTIADEVFGIYNDVSATGTLNSLYGMYSTEGTTDIYLNYNGTYSLFTNDKARFDGGIQIGANTNDVINTTSGAATTANLYYGNEQICTNTNGACGITNGSLYDRHLQIDTANSQVSSQVVRKGWGYIVGDTTTQIEETVTTGITYDNNPVIIVSANGSKSTTPPANITECINQVGTSYNVYSTDVTTTTFEVDFTIEGGSTFSSSEYYCYTWVAIGTYSSGYGADLAENFITYDISVEPGDIIAIDENNDIAVRKSNQAYDQKIFGIVATAPGQVLGGSSGESSDLATAASIEGYIENETLIDSGEAKVVPVALEGRVPIKVNLENGPIKKGDYLTASSKPGYAMKAIEPGNIIGRALEDFDGEAYLSTIPNASLASIIQNTELTIDQVELRQRSFARGEGMIMTLVEKGFGAGEGDQSVTSQIDQLGSDIEETNSSSGIVAVILFSILGILILMQNKQITKIHEFLKK